MPEPFEHQRDPADEAYYQSLEESSLPYHLLQKGKLKLSDKHPGVKVRCVSAFEAGQRARNCIDNDCPYTPRRKIQGCCKNRVWVVLRATLVDPFIAFSSEETYSATGRQQDKLLILETFDSLAEAEIFWEGASKRLPPRREEAQPSQVRGAGRGRAPPGADSS